MMSKVSRVLGTLMALSFLLCTGCFRQARRDTATGNLLSRASFDMNCPREELDVTVLSQSSLNVLNTAGVRGCGQQAVYIRRNDHTNWVLDTPTSTDAASPSEDEAENE